MFPRINSSGANALEKVKKRERRSGSQSMLFLSKKAEKDQELKLEEFEKGATQFG